MYTPFVNILLTKTCFSIYITHSSINLTKCALLSHQKISWQTSVQAWNTLFDLLPFWITSKQIFHWEYIIFAINPFQIMQSLHLWRKFLKKLLLIIEWPSYICIYIYTRVCVCACVCMHIYIYIYIYMLIYEYIWVYVYAWICIYRGD